MAITMAEAMEIPEFMEMHPDFREKASMTSQQDLVDFDEERSPFLSKSTTRAIRRKRTAHKKQRQFNFLTSMGYNTQEKPIYKIKFEHGDRVFEKIEKHRMEYRLRKDEDSKIRAIYLINSTLTAEDNEEVEETELFTDEQLLSDPEECYYGRDISEYVKMFNNFMEMPIQDFLEKCTEKWMVAEIINIVSTLAIKNYLT